jgi:hypothetical protein
MPGMALGDLTSRLTTNARARVDSITRETVNELRTQGIVPALIGIGTRFGRNNRALFPMIAGH